MSSREAALASERLARATYDRYLNLKKEDSVSAQEFDEVEARYLQAKAAVRPGEGHGGNGYRPDPAEPRRASHRPQSPERMP